jgi:putative SOS response-associated peptidase YedK
VIVNDSKKHVEMMQWGLVPFWAKDEKSGYKMINARAETLPVKPSFRKALSLQRCIIPAGGFFEWKHVDKEKIPYYIFLKNQSVFGFAGLYDVWHDKQGRELKTYTIITTEPNALVEPIHNRMPVILEKQNEYEWLNPDETEPARLVKLLHPYPAWEMEAYPVSRLVNSPANDTKEVIEPATDLG